MLNISFFLSKSNKSEWNLRLWGNYTLFSEKRRCDFLFLAVKTYSLTLSLILSLSLPVSITAVSEKPLSSQEVSGIGTACSTALRNSGSSRSTHAIEVFLWKTRRWLKLQCAALRTQLNKATTECAGFLPQSEKVFRDCVPAVFFFTVLPPYYSGDKMWFKEQVGLENHLSAI